MSKQSEAKERQDYQAKPIPRTCMHCHNYLSDHLTRKHAFGEFTQEKNIRCRIGEFAVKKNATCKLWQVRQR